MNFTVVWTDDAEADLMSNSLRALDKPAIWRAANAIDRQLERNPLEAGESRGGGYRVFIVRPLSVFYRVDEDDRKVYVERVRWVGA